MSETSARWSDLGLRLASAGVLVPVTLFCVWQGGLVYDLLILLAMFGLVWEGESLIGQPLKTWRGVLLLLWPPVAGLAALRGEWSAAFWMIWPSLIFGSPACIPVVVSIVGGLSLLWLRHLPSGMVSVLFVIAVVIASDSFAYLTGRVLGGPRLAPSISPGKTRSGAIGGLFGAALTGAGVAWSASRVGDDALLTALGGGLTGALLGVFSQAGDLFESAAKRRLGVKDSGRLIPGHGGLLDRFDGLLAAAPLAALLSLLVAAGMSGAPDRPFWSILPAGLISGSASSFTTQGISSHD